MNQLLIEVGAGLAVLIGLFWLGHHSGFKSGQAERIAYYAPLIEAANTERDKANARAATRDVQASQITQQIEAEHADHEKELNDRVVAANERIAQLLHDYARRAAGGRQLPQVPASPGAPAGPQTEIDQRIDRFAERLGGISGGAEADASDAADWQEWYAQQRALADARDK